ncbi:hypothetical protein ABTD85_21600, partial [Acinetobacter baumannii]
QASEAIINFNNIGLSILEIGHRTNWFIDVMEEARNSVKELMQLTDEYEVLFCMAEQQHNSCKYQ